MAKQYLLSERDYMRIQSALRWVERNRNLRNPLRRRGGATGGGNVVRRAKAQEDSQTDGKLSVKLLDGDDAVYGDAFDVYAFPDKAATDMTDYLPDIDTNDSLLVCKANDGNWYLVWPVLTEVGIATNTVSLTAGTIFGRVTNVYGTW